MTVKTEQRLRRIRAVVLCLLVPVACVLLAVSCVGIYRSGEAPFTRASIGEALGRIAVPLVLTAVAVAAGGVLEWILPASPARPRRYVDRRAAVCKLHAGIDPAKCTPAEREAVRVCRALDVMLPLTAAVLILVAALPSARYLAVFSHFGTQELNGNVAAAALALLPFCVIAFGICTVTDFLREENLAYLQARLVRCYNRGARREKAAPAHATRAHTRLIWAVRLAVLALGVALVVLGVCNGGMRDVLGKAIKICTECIGLG
jgi:hypothetical protein